MTLGIQKRGVGVTGGAATSVSSISPTSGYSIGGDDFVVAGVGFDPRDWDDLFTGVILDVALWTDTSAGGGSVATGVSHLTLDTGAVAGGLASITSVKTWANTQGEARVIIPPITYTPTTQVNHFMFTLYIDASNWVSINLVVDPAIRSGLTLECDVRIGGSTTTVYSAAWTTGLSVFKILRYGSIVYFVVNGAIVATAVFVAPVASFVISANNNAENLELISTVSWFYFRPYAVFAEELIHDTTIVSDIRLRGATPPSKDSKGQSATFAGDVDVVVVGNGDDTSVDAFEYTFKDHLKIINSVNQDVDLQMVDDDQMITPENVKRGLGV